MWLAFQNPLIWVDATTISDREVGREWSVRVRLPDSFRPPFRRRGATGPRPGGPAVSNEAERDRGHHRRRRFHAGRFADPRWRAFRDAGRGAEGGVASAEPGEAVDVARRLGQRRPQGIERGK